MKTFTTTIKRNADAIVFVVSMTFILLALGSLVFAIATGQVNTNLL